MRCPACEADNPDDARKCGTCGKRLARRSRRRDDEEEGLDPLAQRLPYNNPPALYGYRLGMLGLIPVVGLFVGPIALVLGVIGWRRTRTNPELKGAGHAIFGAILGALEVLVGAVGLILILIGCRS